MTSSADKYTKFVDHPRYGRGPRITGLNPKPFADGVHLHWNTYTLQEAARNYEAVIGGPWPYGLSDSHDRGKRIPSTAVVADLEKQTPATIAVTHYFDLERKCRDCKWPFIFFAEEQKHWYEELGFGLDSDCVRCVECRKKRQDIAQARELYETLFHVKDRTVEQNLQMAEAGLSLIESGEFNRRQTERMRMLLNAVPTESEARSGSHFTDIVTRLHAICTERGDGVNPQ